MPYRRFQPSSLLQPTRRNKRVRSERTCGFYASSLSLGSPSDVRIVRVLLKDGRPRPTSRNTRNVSHVLPSGAPLTILFRPQSYFRSAEIIL
jgi:hypothetical protein